MPESEEEKGFKVTDKRRVTLDDQGKEPPKEETPPKMAEAPKEHKGEAARIDFSTFILSLGSSALIFLGDIKDPIHGAKGGNIPQAREMIDLLDMLEKKTKGNLNKEEESLIAGLLFDLRMKYVEKTSKSGKQGGG